MLQIFSRPQWLTIAGRSKTYVDALEKSICSSSSGAVRKGVAVESILRSSDGASFLIAGSDGMALDDGVFTHVFLALPPPISSKIIEDLGPPSQLTAALTDVRYAENRVLCHGDPSFMPKSGQNGAWASWNCIGSLAGVKCAVEKGAGGGIYGGEGGRLGGMEGSGRGFGSRAVVDRELSTNRMKECYVTYWLTNLQNLPTNVFVTLNPPTEPRDTYHERKTCHPQFSRETILARGRLKKDFGGGILGGIWFGGAWGGWGFHEDGCREGMEAAMEIVKDIKGEVGKKESKEVSVVGQSSIASDDGWGRLPKFFGSIPRKLAKNFLFRFMGSAIKTGTLKIVDVQGETTTFGDGTGEELTMKIWDDRFWGRCCWSYDLGFAR